MVGEHRGGRLTTTLPEILPLSLDEFYASLGLLRYMEPDTEDLMREKAKRDWRRQEHVRGEYWNTSLHASEFPGDDRDACPRYLAYRMMDFAPADPMPPWVTVTGDVGKAIELSIARAWYEGGRSLTVPDDLPGGGQLVFVHKDHWMTGSVDLPVLKYRWRKPHICEIKAKASEVVEKMMRGERRWDEPHRRQVLATLALAHRHDWGTVQVCEETWRLAVLDETKNPFLGEEPIVCRVHGDSSCLIELDLEPPDTASIYYADRSWPRKTVEYVFKYDPRYLERGLEVVDLAREHFVRGEIPPRPKHFQWSMGACKWCSFKRDTCKPDFIKRSHRDDLTDSHGIAHTREVRGEYDPDEARQRVLDRWRDD